MATPVFSEYLNALKAKRLKLDEERRKQLLRISAARGGRDVIVYAADLTQRQGVINGMEYADILPFHDQLASLPNKTREIDIIIETPGGIAEVAEQLVGMVRARYDRVGMIVPGWAKSAGTIFVMSGDEILMGETSALGPIDPQMLRQGKGWSANAFLDGLEKIKQEVTNTGKLNPAYFPILQAISPGEIQNCQNAKEFSQALVRDWLQKYKFKYWERHSTRDAEVTPEEKKQRASEIAAKLSDHSTWLTHGRSIGIAKLTEIGLKIVDYSGIPELEDAINRYYALLRISFLGATYKILETPTSQVKRVVATQPPAQTPAPAPLSALGAGTKDVVVKVVCPKCKTENTLQINFAPNVPLKPGATAFPLATNKFACSKCSAENDVSPIRKMIEQQIGKPAI